MATTSRDLPFRYITLASGKHFHPAHPPNDDFPTSWTDTGAGGINPYYWGNSPPIGDASACNTPGHTITYPLADKYGNRLACYNNATDAMDDHDNKTAPQAAQPVEYAHRLATRTIEYLTYAKQQQKPFFIGVGIRKPHLPWRHPEEFWKLYEGRQLATAKHQVDH